VFYVLCVAVQTLGFGTDAAGAANKTLGQDDERRGLRFRNRCRKRA
jgi:hypothetical protein